MITHITHTTHIHIHIRTYVHTYIHTHIHTCIHTYMHAYIHTYIHTYAHCVLWCCSYNALKFYSQGGNVDVQLSSLVHLTMASCAGEAGTHTHKHCQAHTHTSIVRHTHTHTLGIATMSLVNPVWVVKTRMCLISTEGVPPHRKYRNVLGDRPVAIVSVGCHSPFLC